MRAFLFPILLAVLSLTAPPALAEPDPARFRALFDALAAKGPVAMGAGYVHGDEAPVIAVSGTLYKGSAQPVAPDAPWHVGSITKSFTATLIARLAERGVIGWNQNLAELLPEYAGEMHADWASLMLPEILSHTAGLAPNFTNAEMGAPYGDDLRAARLDRLRAHWGKPPPGKRGEFNYSNMGYVLAGLVAETRADKPWQVLIRDEIATPLGLDSLGFGAPKGPDAPHGHRRLFFIAKPMDPGGPGSDNPAWLGPAGTLHMSLRDLLTWGEVHMQACRGARPDFLSQASCTRLHTPVAQGYAMGWIVGPLADTGVTVHMHDGSNTMWVAHLAFVPEADLVLTLTMNEARLMKSESYMLQLGKALLAE